MTDLSPIDEPGGPLLDEQAPAPARPKSHLVVVVVFAVLLVVVSLLPTPYVIERPGPVFDTLGTTKVDGVTKPIIDISGHATYPSTGHLDLLTVSVVGQPGDSPSWLDVAISWFDPAQRVVPMEDVYPQGVTDRQIDAQNSADMKQSQQSAIAAALLEQHEHVEGTVTVAGAAKSTPASGVLERGDTISTFNGSTVVESCQLQSEVVANGADRAAAIGIVRDGAASTVHITPKLVDTGDGTRPLLGIATTESLKFPFDVTLRLADVGGPSAGMMFALGIIDRLTPGSLTGGAHVAGTGTICSDGAVGAIGGIVQKMTAARRAGATVFLAPESNCSEVTGHIPSGLQVFAVATLDDSLAVLKAVSSGASTSRLRTCPAG